MVELVSRRRFDVPKLGRFWDAGWPWNIQEGFRLFRCCYFNWKFTEFHRLGPGWAGNLYGILLDPSIPPNNPIDYQPEDGATKLSNENSAIWNRWNRVFTCFQHRIQWVEMGWKGLKYVWVISTADYSIAHSAQVRVQMPDGTKNMCLVWN